MMSFVKTRSQPSDDRPRRRKKGSLASESVTDEPRPSRYVSADGLLSTRDVLALGLLASALLWAAFPPLGLWPLAFVAPVPWVWMARRGVGGWRCYLALWISGVVFWLALLQGIRLAHWALYFGWISLSAYVAVYTPLFVGLTSSAVNRLRWPVFLAAPVVWTSLELVRGYLLTGFSIGLLGHAVVERTMLIQVADVFGAYGVSFVLMFIASCLARMLPAGGECFTWKPLGYALAILAVAIAYGGWRMRAAEPSEERSIKVAVIQGSVDTIFEYNPQRNAQAFLDYREQIFRVRTEHPDLNLVVWPESIYTGNEPEYLLDDDAAAPPEVELPDDQFRALVAERADLFELKNQLTMSAINRPPNDGEVEPLDIHCLVGVETVEFAREPLRYNASLWLTPDGEVAGRYYKMHLVMFGEYIPLGGWFPWLYSLTPMGGGLAAGESPTSFEIAGLRLSPNICFESTVPHLIRRHWRQLDRAGNRPDVLVTLTNDGWFWGSSILDHHLACSVFRAVELRTPMLVAANTGISAVIDGNGQVLQRGPKRQSCELVATVTADPRGSLYRQTGDLGALLCLLATLGIAITAVVGRYRRKAGNS